MAKGYRWRGPPKTVDDYMERVRHDMWMGDYKAAGKTLFWLMSVMIKNEEEHENKESQ